MSGILGIFHRDQEPVSAESLGAMLAGMAHRARDGSELWAGGCAGLGHARFNTTPEADADKMPLVDAAGSVVLTADARLDNRDELIRELFAGESRAEPIPGGRIILRSWQRWGTRCVEHLDGDFAFAIWDGAERRLFCARDHSGVRPFYYHASPRRFAFASEIGPLLALPGVGRRLNETRIADLLVGFCEDLASTCHEGILRLPPAHHLTVTQEGQTLVRYWELDPSRELRLPGPTEYFEEFRRLFTQAVQTRIRSCAPVAAELSGGLDSSSITAVAHRMLRETGPLPLHTITARFPTLLAEHPYLDDEKYVRLITSKEGIAAHDVCVDGLDPLASELWELDELQNIPNLFMFAEFFKLAGRAGARVVLSGHDGDSTVSHGWESLPWMARTGRWGGLWREANCLAKVYEADPWRIIWRSAVRPAIPASLRRMRRALLGRATDGGAGAIRGVIDPAFAERIGMAERVRSHNRRPAAGRRTFRDGHRDAIASGLHLYALEVCNALGARAGVEPRYPFYDRRLIEFCLAVPLTLKLHDGRPRYILREALAPDVPAGILQRMDKTIMSANFCTRLLSCGGPTVERELFQRPETVVGFVDLESVKAAWQRMRTQPLRGEQDAIRVFFATGLALWMRRHG